MVANETVQYLPNGHRSNPLSSSKNINGIPQVTQPPPLQCDVFLVEITGEVAGSQATILVWILSFRRCQAVRQKRIV